MSRISVLIPTYNAEQYIEKCIESVLVQSFPDLEIICINDGSTDGSKEIIDRYATKDCRIRTIHKANSGYGHSMNIGLKSATGDYIAIVEADDYVLPNMMQSLFDAAELNRLDFVKADFYRFVEQSNGETMKVRNYLAPNDTDYYRVFCPTDYVESFRFAMNIWCGLYRTSFLKENQISFNESPGAAYQDNGFWFKTMVCAQRVMLIRETGYMNRRDNPNSSVYARDKIYAVKNEYDHIRSWIDQEYSGREQQQAIRLLSEARLQRYSGVLSRLKGKAPLELFEVMHNEFRGIIDNNEISVTCLSERLKRFLKNVLSEPKDFCQKDSRLRMEYERILGGFSEVMIYGAGKYGKHAFELLAERGYRYSIRYFVINEGHEHDNYIHGVPVMILQELPILYREKALFIICVRDELIDEMEKELLVNNVKHYIKLREIIEVN